MRVAPFFVLMATALAGNCDTSTCAVCLATAGCSWYTSPVGSISDCRETSNVTESLGFTPQTTCPVCQAGTCTECTNQTLVPGNCNWYVNSVSAYGGTCGNASSPPPSPVGGNYSAYNGTCPACKDSTSCATCTNDPVCAWYELPGGVGNKCREASPGFAYTKVTAAYCSNKNPCAGVGTCTECKAVNVSENNQTSNPCSWYTPKSGMEVLYGPKCDLGAPGTVEGTFYNAATTCPPCSGTSCTTCQAETGCQWVAVVALTVASFGQCQQSTATIPTGKQVVSTCPAECEIYSCTGCVANDKCTWYSGSSLGGDDTCDRASDSAYHPLTTSIRTASACPKCKASRCFECNNEAGCGWYVNTIPGIGTEIPGTGDCANISDTHTNAKLIENSNSKCDGASDAASLVPGFVSLLVAAFLYHN